MNSFRHRKGKESKKEKEREKEIKRIKDPIFYLFFYFQGRAGGCASGAQVGASGSKGVKKLPLGTKAGKNKSVQANRL